MSRKREQRASEPGWLSMAEPYDHHLEADHPIWVGGGGEPGPTPLHVHIHKGMDLGIALGPGLELHYGELVLRPKAGDAWLGAMWEPHAWRLPGDGARVVVVTFLPDVLEEGLDLTPPLLGMFAPPPDERPSVTSEKTRALMISIGEEILEEARERREDWEAAVRICLVRALFSLRREWHPSEDARQMGGVDSNLISRVMPALTLAHSNLGRRVSAIEGAAACALTPSWFHRIFRQAMGLSYGAFCRRMRVAHAARELLTSDQSIETIAERFAFADGSHLHRQFVAQFGCTPAEYRRKGRPEGYGQ